MLFARGAEKRQRPAVGTTVGVYRCSRCAAPLELERVRAVDAERKGHAVTGYVVFQHSCACSPERTWSSRAWGTHAAFCALFGSQPWLPYRAPYRFGVVPDDHPGTLRWRWELNQVADVDDFLLFLEDARLRRPQA